MEANKFKMFDDDRTFKSTLYDRFRQLASKWSGGYVLHSFCVTRHEFGNILRFTTLCFSFLVPDSDLLDDLEPSHALIKNEREDDADGTKLLLV